MNDFNPLRDAVPLQEVQRVLVIKLRHHGDVLLSSPVFSALKAAAPHVEIDALVYADTAEMLTLHPAIRRVHVIDRKWKKQGVGHQLKQEWALLDTLRAARYDLVLHLTEHWRGAWLCRLLKPRWSVGCTRVDAGRAWHRSFSHLYKVSGGLPRHTVERNLDALRRIGVRPALADRALRLVPGAEAEARVRQRLTDAEVSGPFIHIHPASRWFFKCWPAERMAALISMLQAQGHQVVLTAAPSQDELAMVGAIQAGLARPVPSLAGQLSLKELAALTGMAQAFVGVDSAPMHIAAAMAVPVVALFGPSGEKQWGPWSARARVVASEHHLCRPCGNDGCGGGKVSDCLENLPVTQVMAALQDVLQT